MHTRRRAAWLLLALVLLLAVIAAWVLYGHSQTADAPTYTALREIALAGPAARARTEFSGLAWYGDTLILLPQYPERMGAGSGILFALSKQEILAYLDGTDSQPLRPREIAFKAPPLRKQIRGYEGFEAIAFLGDTVFLTIEASPGAQMKSYLLRGAIQPDLSELALEPDMQVEVPLDVKISNYSNEALLVDGEQVIVFFEANAVGEEGAATHAYVYTQDLSLTDSLVMPPLPFRLTDASALDADGRFWVSNFFFPLDLSLFTTSDPLADHYGIRHKFTPWLAIERLVELQLQEKADGSVTFSQTPPIQLHTGWLPRNWEGLVRLDERGFLLVTDKFPRTILGFVESPH